MPLVALLPLSADPPTVAHADLLQRAAQKFDKVVWSIGHNPDKRYLFSLADRLTMLKMYVEHFNLSSVSVEHHSGATALHAQSLGADVVIKGLRQAFDYTYECVQADVNHHLNAQVETLFMMTRPELSTISSSVVRQLIQLGQPIDRYVIPSVSAMIGRLSQSVQ